MRHAWSLSLAVCALLLWFPASVCSSVDKILIKFEFVEESDSEYLATFRFVVSDEFILADYDNMKEEKSFTPSQIMLVDPAGQSRSLPILPSKHTVSREENLVTYERKLRLSLYSLPGIWFIAFIYFHLSDDRSHYYDSSQLLKRGYMSTFKVHVDPDQYDNEPPQLVSLQFLPPLSDVQQHLLYTELAIDLYGNDIETGTHVSFVVDTALRLRLHIRDNLSGLQRLFMDGEPRILSYIQLVSAKAPEPSGQSITVDIVPSLPQLVQGTATDGVYELHIPLHERVYPGEWQIKEMSLTDDVGNTLLLGVEALRIRGLETSTTVRNFNLTYNGYYAYDYSFIDYWHPSDNEPD